MALALNGTGVMGQMKLTVIGCGSTSTPAIVEVIAGELAALEVREIALVNPDRQRLAALGASCQQILDEADHPATISTTTEVEKGAHGANAVILQLHVGGDDAWRSDLTFPLEHGCVGHDTVGAGGIARALRTVPLAVDIAERVRAVADDKAWIVNATRPVGIVTRALLQDKHPVLGIGGESDAFRPWVADLLGVPAEVVTVQHVGVTQVSWARNVLITGPNAMVDVLPALLAEQAAVLGEEVGLPGALLRRSGSVPNYWAKYFFRHAELVAEQQDSPRSAEEDAPAGDTLAAEPFAADGVRAARLVAALQGRAPIELPVTTRNSGLLPFLSQQAVVEAPALVDATGARTLPVLPLPATMSGLISHVTASEAHALEAARDGSRDAVADALLTHPLIREYALAEALTDALLAENQDFLPWAKN